jgi:peptide/nickel transport system substrate-binding protein
VKFHDGKDMTVDDVVYSVNEIWKKYGAAAALTDFAGVEATDAETVVITFNKPTPEFFFSSMLCGTVTYIVPKHVYDGSDPVTNPANNAPIGTGPWKFKEWVRGSHFEYAKNEDYWRNELPYLDRLIIRYVRDAAGRAAAIEAGEIQIGVLNPVPAPDVKRLTTTGKFVATTKGYEESVWSTTLECNMRNPVFAKREVRQAMFHAIDRHFIARTVFYGYARPGTGPICSPNTAFFTPDTYKTEFDPKKAASLLDAAGFPKKADGKRFALNLVAAGWFPENGKIGSYVKQALEDVGVAINLTVPDRPTSIKRIYTDYDFDLAISNQANPSEPVPSTTQYYTSDGIKKGVPFRNASGFHTDEVDALVEQIKVETDAVKRKALVVEFEKIITLEAPLLPLVELESITVASTKVQNHSNDPNYLAASWYDIWLAS